MADDFFEKIKSERTNILLAEMGAMIHNLGKMSQEHLIDLKTELHLYFGDWLYDQLQNESEEKKSQWGSFWNIAKTAKGIFYPENIKNLLQDLSFKFQNSALDDRTYRLREFSILRKKALYDGDKFKNLIGATSILGRLLAEAHGMAVGGDKGFVLQTDINQQNPHLMHLSSPFGYEIENLSERQIDIEKNCLLLNLKGLLEKIKEHLHSSSDKNDINFWYEIRKNFFETLKRFTSIYIADTRYPVNDVDLFGFHYATASFFKAGIAKTLADIDFPDDAKDAYQKISEYKWRLLSVRYNGLDYIMRARGVNDMLAKKQALENAMDEIRTYFEVELPIANEVYRDENGVVYLFPDLEKQQLNMVKEKISERVASVFQQETKSNKTYLDSDIKPKINISSASRQALLIGKILKEQTPIFNQSFKVKTGNKKIKIDGKDVYVDLCQSCNMRFIGSGLKDKALEKAYARKLCGVCYNRRSRRAQLWWEKDKDKTIWMDEVADDNGQLALVIGRFELENWLDGIILNSMLTNTIHEFNQKRSDINSYHNLIKKFELAIKNKHIRLSEIIRKKDSNDIFNSIYAALSINYSFLREYKNKSILSLLKDVPDPFNFFISFKVTDKTISNLRRGKTSPKNKTLQSLERIKDKVFYSEEKFIEYLETNLEKEQFEKHKEKILNHSIIFKNGEELFLISNCKKSSFSRLARIWQCTKNFNANVPNMVQTYFHSQMKERYFIKATDTSNDRGSEKTFKKTHVYEFRMGNVSVPLYCVKGSEGKNVNLEFVSAYNLDYYEKAFNFDMKEQLEEGDKITTNEEGEEFKIEIKSVKKANNLYYPIIDIFSEPQMFMMLVPADWAMEVVEMIKNQYELQFSKVKNRLPLNLGVVFAKRRQPLYTIIETGRKVMAGLKSDPVIWHVQENAYFDKEKKSVTVKFDSPRREKNDLFSFQQEWEVKVDLAKPEAIDYYYPYFYTEYDEGDEEIKNRTNVFLAPLPKQDEQSDYKWKYVCHVSELKEGDEVYVTPSFFDFEFLEVPGRRFDIYYENNQRTGVPSKPFLLDELDQINSVWEAVANGNLTNAQFRGILEVIEKRREEWLEGDADEQDNDTFDDFVKYTLYTQAEKWMKSLDDETRNLVIHFAKNGRLLDVYELYMKILKHKLEG